MLNSHWKIDVLLAGSWRGASSVLLSNGSERILVDTGLPHDAHQLLTALEHRGLAPSGIKRIINTHFHIDHVSNNSLFPGSLIFATQQSFDWCHSLYSDLACTDWERLVLKYYPEVFEYENAKQRMEKLRKIALRWWNSEHVGSRTQFRWIETCGLPYGIDVMLTSGHVPGHASLILNTDQQQVVIAGDALLTRAHDDQVLTMIPYCRPQYQQDRERILEIAGVIVPGHDQTFQNAPSKILATVK